MGDRRQNIITAVSQLAERVGNISALSSFYETAPWGFESKNTFINVALSMETPLSPEKLLDVTQQIESEMGRTQKTNGAYHDRIIDIDILMFEDRIMHTPVLILPHPLMHQRLFVMEPLAEIASDTVHPVLKKTIGQLYKSLSLG